MFWYIKASGTHRLTAVAGNQAFVYDPFGNLLQENVTAGSAPKPGRPGMSLHSTN